MAATPLMKPLFDYAIYPQLLADLQPKNMLKIGSGSGASALWRADSMSQLTLFCHVRSVDIINIRARA